MGFPFPFPTVIKWCRRGDLLLQFSYSLLYYLYYIGGGVGPLRRNADRHGRQSGFSVCPLQQVMFILAIINCANWWMEVVMELNSKSASE